MTRIQKQRYARAVLLAQDKIALKYQRKIRAELKIVSKELAESYKVNQSNADFDTVRNAHKKRMIVILSELAQVTAQAFKAFNFKPEKKDIFGNFVENNIYAILTAEAMAVAGTVSNNTIATAQLVITQVMAASINNPTISEPENIALLIANRIGGVSAIGRAMTIARTETHKAANVSQYTRAESAALDSGLEVEVEWISTNDSRVRDNHKHADGQKRAIGNPFNVGGELMMFPSDPNASASNTINCRCVLGYDTK